MTSSIDDQEQLIQRNAESEQQQHVQPVNQSINQPDNQAGQTCLDDVRPGLIGIEITGPKPSSRKSTKSRTRSESVGSEEDEKEEILTLLQKALKYRDKNREEWEARQKEEEQEVRQSLGLFEKDIFLENYYMRMEKIRQEEEKIEDQLKSEFPKLYIQLQFNHPRSPTANKFNNDFLETYESIAADGVSVFDKDDSILDFFKKQSSEERGKEPEMLITVTKIKSVHNILPEGKQMQDCKIKCHLYPDCDKRGPKLRSKYVYCNIKGKAKWNHVFVLKGYSTEELSRKYVVLEAVGKRDDEKITVGRTILVGEHAKVNTKGLRGSLHFTNEDCYYWHQALAKPGTVVNVVNELQHFYSD